MVEFIIIIVVVGLQGYFTFVTWQRSETLAGMFPLKKATDFHLKEERVLLEDKSEQKIQTIDLKKSWQSSFKEIIRETNDYLRKSAGAAANLETIEAIANRADEALDQKTASGVSLPLYIGLMGTMVSIIAGLWGIDGDLAKNDLESILAAVKIAMMGSVSGLGLTILSSVAFLRPARTERDYRKGAYFNFLQTNLQAVLGSDLTSAIRNLDAQFRGFDRQLIKFNQSFAAETERFEEAIHNHAKQIRDEWQSNLHGLQQGLEQNVDKFQESTHAVLQHHEQATLDLHQGLKIQERIVAEVKDLNVARLAKLNADSAEKLKSAADAVSAFQAYQEKLQEVTKQTTTSMARAKETFDTVHAMREEFGGVLASINRRVSDTEQLFSLLREGIGDLQEIKDGNHKTLESIGNSNRRVVGDQEKSLEAQAKAFKEALDRSYKQQIDLLREYSGKAEQELKASLIGVDMGSISKDVAEVKKIVQNRRGKASTDPTIALLGELVAGNKRIEALLESNLSQSAPKKGKGRLRRWWNGIFSKREANR